MSGFYRFGEPGSDTVAHINTGRRSSGQRCVMPRFEADSPQHGELCGRMSVALCDAPLNGSRNVTCDRPICDLHRTEHDTRANTDYCPDHKSLAQGRGLAPAAGKTE